MDNIKLQNTASIKFDSSYSIGISNAFQCLSTLYKDQFNKSNLNKTHTFVIDEENETIWVRKK